MVIKLKPLSGFKVEFEEDDTCSVSECINKIMNTLSFRKLAGKTQVILSISGPDVRTRLTHTIEVAKITRDICSELGLNEDLAEAIALAHDLGHTPFGHVGERTLREFMCGCNTLSDGETSKVLLENSGFKHNLQTFRVLKDFENITEGNNAIIWPYILWGASDHTKMSYAGSYSGMEDELFISNKHCDYVYSCAFCNGDQCKYNNHNEKNEKSKTIQTDISSCKPWLCGSNSTDIGENNCPLCYMARLWKNKLDPNNIDIYRKYKYFFDHPFPNIFYSYSFYNYFYNGEIKNWFSIESLIVKNADEIAQRQEDLEDGINKGLLALEEAKDYVTDLISCFNCDNEFSAMLFDIEKTSNPQQLGELIVKFYKRILVHSTEKNIMRFQDEKIGEENINIYFLMDVLYKIQNQNSKSNWLLKELNNIENQPPATFNNNYLNNYFKINLEKQYLFFIIYDYLEGLTRLGDFSQETKEILIGTLDYLDKKYNYYTLIKRINLTKCNKAEFLDEINHLRNFLKGNDSFKDIYDEFFRTSIQQNCKYIEDLKLLSYFILTKLVSHHKEPISETKDLYIIDEIHQDLKNQFIKNRNSIFHSWKNNIKITANRVLANSVAFCWLEDPKKQIKETALKKFKKAQKSTILKSELVEKNDGKASYILRKLFKAYFNNIHQIPDEGLKLIFFSLKKERNLIQLFNNEKLKFEELIKNLKGVIVLDEPDKKINAICGIDFENAVIDQSQKYIVEKAKKGTLNEIKFLIDEKVSLYDFLVNRMKKNKTITEQKNYYVKDSSELRKILREFRAILDNSILNAIPFWNNIVIRGICDYISSLTDQEAINEYEKLYSGLMEIA